MFRQKYGSPFVRNTDLSMYKSVTFSKSFRMNAQHGSWIIIGNLPSWFGTGFDLIQTYGNFRRRCLHTSPYISIGSHAKSHPFIFNFAVHVLYKVSKSKDSWSNFSLVVSYGGSIIIKSAPPSGTAFKWSWYKPCMMVTISAFPAF